MRKYFSKYSLEIVKEDNIEYEGKISTRECAYNKFLEVFKLNKKAEEHLVMFGLNNRNEIIAAFLIAKGNSNSVYTNMCDIIKRIVLCNSRKIIIAHNHPSGYTTPSKEDINITNRLKKVCNLINVEFLDHLIIGDDGYQAVDN